MKKYKIFNQAIPVLFLIYCFGCNNSFAQNTKDKLQTAPDSYQTAIKNANENQSFIENNKYKFDTATTKKPEPIDFSQNITQTFLKLYMQKEKVRNEEQKRMEQKEKMGKSERNEIKEPNKDESINKRKNCE